MNIECSFLGLQLPVERPPDADRQACVPRRGRVSLGVDVGEGLAGSSWSKSQLQRTQRQPST